MIDKWLSDQFKVIERKMKTWPEWERKELEAEINRTPRQAARNDVTSGSRKSTTEQLD